MTEEQITALHVVPQTSSGMLPIFTQRQIETMAAMGVKGETVPLSGSALERRPVDLYRAIQALRASVRSTSPDVVHAHWGSLLGAACVSVCGSAGPPVVVTFRGSDVNPAPSEQGYRSVVRRTLSAYAARRAAAVVTVSSELASRLRAKPQRAYVIPDGVDLDCFFPRDRTRARQKLGWPLNRTVVLFNEGGRPLVKRTDLAEAAVAVARLHLPDLHLEVMRGDIDRSDVALRMSASNCLLMTSDHEGSPNVVREALACGVSVVSVPVGDVSQWLVGTRGTRIVERDASAIGSALVELIAQDERPALGEEVRALGERASGDALMSVYRQVIADSRLRAGRD